MKYDEDHESPDVIDRRGEGGGSEGFGGGGGGGVNPFFLFALLRTPYGWVVLLGIGVWYGLTRFGVIGGGDEPRPAHGAHAAHTQSATEAKEEHFVSFVLDDAQATWTRVFQAEGKTYRHAKLVLFTDRVQTACGGGSAATGPFYCPSDERVYIDLGFYAELSQKLGARGQFAQAYVVAHEIGHHVQKLLGTSDHVKGDSERGAAGNSVRLELQADCFAGIWATPTKERKLLEAGRHRSRRWERGRHGSATIACRRWGAAPFAPSRSRTARARSASAGSPQATRPAKLRRVTPSARPNSEARSSPG